MSKELPYIFNGECCRCWENIPECPVDALPRPGAPEKQGLLDENCVRCYMCLPVTYRYKILKRAEKNRKGAKEDTLGYRRKVQELKKQLDFSKQTSDKEKLIIRLPEIARAEAVKAQNDGRAADATGWNILADGLTR